MNCKSQYYRVGIIVSLLCIGGCSKAAISELELQNEPLTIAVSTEGRFARGKGYPWHLNVNSAGKAELTIDTIPRMAPRQFEVSQKQIAELRQILWTERFFDLEDEYGESPPDSSTQTIKITVGDRTKTVTISFLMNWVQDDKAKLQEPARALRVLLFIREWFDDANAVDHRRFDRTVLEAVGEGS